MIEYFPRVKVFLTHVNGPIGVSLWLGPLPKREGDGANVVEQVTTEFCLCTRYTVGLMGVRKRFLDEFTLSRSRGYQHWGKVSGHREICDVAYVVSYCEMTMGETRMLR